MPSCSAHWPCARPVRTCCRPPIAALQTEDPIDWPQVAELYGELARLTGSAVVELNRAVAVAHVEGPASALAIVDGLPLADYQYLHSTRGELLLRLGRAAEARAAYLRALELADAPAERRYLRGAGRRSLLAGVGSRSSLRTNSTKGV